MRGRTCSTECAKQSPQCKFNYAALQERAELRASEWWMIWQFCSNPGITAYLQRERGRECNHNCEETHTWTIKLLLSSRPLICLKWRKREIYGKVKVADGDPGVSVVHHSGLITWMGFNLIIVIVLLVSFLRLGPYLLITVWSHSS